MDTTPRFTTTDLPLSVRVSHLVRATGLTHEAIARRLGLSRPVVTDRLRGRSRWTADELPAVAALLGMSLDELAGLTAAPQGKR